MKRLWIICICIISLSQNGIAQNTLTPEMLWKIGRVSGLGLTKDKKNVLYSVSVPNVETNKSTQKTFLIALTGGVAQEIKNADELLENDRISPDGKSIISIRPTKIMNITGAENYPDLPQSNVYIYSSLNYRHWDSWEDGLYDHVFVAPLTKGGVGVGRDIMEGEPFDCPQKPFGGNEDAIWHPDSRRILYVTKKKFGTDYTVSTNTDLYEYDVATRITRNLTEDNKGYDVAPAYHPNGTLAWLQMKRDGYEADKQDLMVTNGTTQINLTGHHDEISVNSFKWSNDGKSLFFLAPINGTIQLFRVTCPDSFAKEITKKTPTVTQLTEGDFDINDIVGESGTTLVVSRSDMNHANELFTLNLTDGTLKQLTDVNTKFYSQLGLSRTERRSVTTTDNKKMLVWVIYPPDFDPSKKYPTLLYCQGGPQVALTQFYSYRWNFQLMASQGYIVVAPNRRGMPGHGTLWNEQVSKDWGGQVLRDYLSAIDELAKEPFVDTSRLGCVGASFGGFSVFALQGIHDNRFKTFISHDGVFDFRSMYGTTDELFFENWEKGGAYWEKGNSVAQRSFSQSPSNFVDQWHTPILIIQGGKDYRVPIEQGLQAFQAAQLKGIKSKLLYFPDENHWVLKPQNALVWQREFFNWLKETL